LWMSAGGRERTQKSLSEKGRTHNLPQKKTVQKQAAPKKKAAVPRGPRGKKTPFRLSREEKVNEMDWRQKNCFSAKGRLQRKGAAEWPSKGVRRLHRENGAGPDWEKTWGPDGVKGELSPRASHRRRPTPHPDLKRNGE